MQCFLWSRVFSKVKILVGFQVLRLGSGVEGAGIDFFFYYHQLVSFCGKLRIGGILCFLPWSWGLVRIRVFL